VLVQELLSGAYDFTKTELVGGAKALKSPNIYESIDSRKND